MDVKRLQATGLRLLGEHGEAISFTSAATSFDPNTGAQTSTTASASGVGYPGQYRASEIDGSVIQAGDIRLTVGRMDSRPKIGWLVDVDATTYRVMDVQAIRASGSDIIYVCQIRSA